VQAWRRGGEGGYSGDGRQIRRKGKKVPKRYKTLMYGGDKVCSTVSG
jgi:hypothetical protein